MRRVHEPLEAAERLGNLGPGPDAVAEQAAELESVVQAMRQLTADQRDVITYRFAAGLTPREIGALMGKREGSIRALQHRSLQALRRFLGEDETMALSRAEESRPAEPSSGAGTQR